MSTTLDPLTLEILWSRLISLADEMAATLLRTSFSTVIGAANDFGCELLDADGHGLAHATRSMPVFNQTLPHVTRRIIEKFGADGIREGDIFITNDPWLCAGHQLDIGVVLPFFRDGQRAGFAASIAHMADIGGALDQNRVQEFYEEGLFIPLTRLYDRGREVDLVLDFVRANTRVPDMIIGDIHAQVSAAQVGAQKALALLDEYGLAHYADLAREIHARSESAMRAAIRAVPDGTYRAGLDFDELDGPIPLRAAVTVRGDEISVDFAGSGPQHPRGGINATLTYTRAHAAYALKCALLPEVPSNAGCYRPITIRAPEGSVLNCTPPASVMNRTKSGWYIAPLLMSALADVMPDQVFAAGGLMGALSVYGIGPDGRPFNSQVFNAGGLGASAHGDGLATTIFPSSASNVPVELFEVAAPVLVTEKEFAASSGGAGQHRGGAGQRVTIQRLPGYAGSVVVSVSPHRQNPAPEGLRGGQAGAPAMVFINGQRLSRDQITRQTGALSLVEGLSVTIQTAGGGGFGPPELRDPQQAASDTVRGLV